MITDYIRYNIGPLIAILFIIIVIINIKFNKNDFPRINLGNSLVSEIIRTIPGMKILFLYLSIIKIIVLKIILGVPGIVLSILYIVLYVVKHYILGL